MELGGLNFIFFHLRLFLESCGKNELAGKVNRERSYCTNLQIYNSFQVTAKIDGDWSSIMETG